jgi:hypothetical protein
MALPSSCARRRDRAYSPSGWATSTGGQQRMHWPHFLAYLTGIVDQALLLRNEYVATEHRMLRNQLTGRVHLTDGERKALAESGRQLGKKALKEGATLVKPDTILAWHRQLVAHKCVGSQKRPSAGRPTSDAELEALWWCAWPKQIAPGGMIVSSERRRTWLHDQRANGGQHPQAPCHSTRSRTLADEHLARGHPHTSGGAGGHRLLHGGGLDVAWTCDLRQPLVYPDQPQRGPCRRADAAA